MVRTRGKKRNISKNNDFKHRKAKVGRKLQRANLTDTTFQAASLRLPTQKGIQGSQTENERSKQSSASDQKYTSKEKDDKDSVESGDWSEEDDVEDEHYPMQHYISLCHHHNIQARKEAVRTLSIRLKKHPKWVKENLATLIDTNVKVMMDVAPGVRRKALGLFYILLQNVSGQDLQAFLPLILVHLKAALCKIQADIRLDSLAFVIVLLSLFPRLVSQYSEELVAVLLQLVSSEQLTVVSRSLVTKLLPAELGIGEKQEHQRRTAHSNCDLLTPFSTQAVAEMMESVYANNSQRKSLTSLETRIGIVWVLGQLLSASNGIASHSSPTLGSENTAECDVFSSLSSVKRVSAIRFSLPSYDATERNEFTSGSADISLQNNGDARRDAVPIRDGYKSLIAVWQECSPNEAHSHQPTILNRMKLVLDVLRLLLDKFSNGLGDYCSPGIPDVRKMSVNKIARLAARDMDLPAPWQILERGNKQGSKGKRRYHERSVDDTTPTEPTMMESSGEETDDDELSNNKGRESLTSEILQQLRTSVLSIFPCQSSAIEGHQKKKKMQKSDEVDPWNDLNLSMTRLFSLFLPSTDVHMQEATTTESIPGKEDVREQFLDWNEETALRKVLTEQQRVLLNPSYDDDQQQDLSAAAGVVVGYGKGSKDVTSVLSDKQKKLLERGRKAAYERADMMAGWYISRLKKRLKVIRNKFEWIPRITEYLAACLYGLAIGGSIPRDIHSLMDSRDYQRFKESTTLNEGSMHVHQKVKAPVTLVKSVKDFVPHSAENSLRQLLVLTGAVFRISALHNESKKHLTKLISSLFDRHLYRPSPSSNSRGAVIPNEIARTWIQHLPRTLWQVGSSDLYVSMEIIKILGSIQFYHLDIPEDEGSFYDDIIKRCSPVLYALTSKGGNKEQREIFGPFISWPSQLQQQFLGCIFNASSLHKSIVRGLRVMCYSGQVSGEMVRFIVSQVSGKLVSKSHSIQSFHGDSTNAKSNKILLASFLLRLVFGPSVDVNDNEEVFSVPSDTKEPEAQTQETISEKYKCSDLATIGDDSRFYIILSSVAKQLSPLDGSWIVSLLLRAHDAKKRNQSTTVTNSKRVRHERCLVTVGTFWLVLKTLVSNNGETGGMNEQIFGCLAHGPQDVSESISPVARFLEEEVSPALILLSVEADIPINLSLSCWNSGGNVARATFDPLFNPAENASCLTNFVDEILELSPAVLFALIKCIHNRLNGYHENGLSLATALHSLTSLMRSTCLHDLRSAMAEQKKSKATSLEALKEKWIGVVETAINELSSADKSQYFHAITEIENIAKYYGLRATSDEAG